MLMQQWPTRLGVWYLLGIGTLYLYFLGGEAFRAEAARRVPNAAPLLSSFSFLSGEPWRTLLLLTAFMILWTGYAFGIKHLRASEISCRSVFFWAFSFAALLTILPPYFSDDIIGYAQYGRVLAEYGQNPYLHTLSEFSDPWAQHRRYWSHMVCPYGPVVTVLLAGVASLAGDNIVIAVVLLKLLMTGCYLVSGRIIGKILETLGDNAPYGVFFFLWNPLILLELVGQGHNESVMIALMLTGFYLMVRRKHDWAFVLLLLSALTKISTLVLLPAHAWLLIRAGAVSKLLKASVFALIALLASYAAFFRDPKSLQGIAETTRLNWLSLTWFGLGCPASSSNPSAWHCRRIRSFLHLANLEDLYRPHFLAGSRFHPDLLPSRGSQPDGSLVFDPHDCCCGACDHLTETVFGACSQSLAGGRILPAADV